MLFVYLSLVLLDATYQFSSVTQSCPTLCNPTIAARQGSCPSPTNRVYSDSCTLSWWCHPTISSSVVPFSFHPQFFPASGSIPMSPFFASCGQSTGVSAWHQSFQWIVRLISFRMDQLDLLAVQETLKCLLQHHSSKASILLCSAFFIVQLSHPYTTTGKAIALTRRTFVGKVTSLFLICCIGWS